MYKGIVNNKEIIFKIDSVAKRANGVLVKSGDTVVLCTAVVGVKSNKENFVPLSVQYIEKFSAINMVPRGYKKREGAPSDSEILKARSIDRALRSSIKEDFQNEVQVFVQVLSYDGFCPQVLGIAGASVALNLANASEKLVSAARLTNNSINCVDKKADFDFLQSVCENKIVSLQMNSKRNMNNVKSVIKYEKNLLFLAKQMQKLQEGLLKKNRNAKKKNSNSLFSIFYDLKMKSVAKTIVNAIFKAQEPNERVKIIESISNEYLKRFDKDRFINSIKLNNYVKEYFVQKIFSNKMRNDGRKLDELRYFTFEGNYLPKLNGSCLFTRADTQVLILLTRGELTDAQGVDSLDGSYKDFLLLHYNFMPYAVGEASKNISLSRREIGHGELARNAIKAVLPERLDSVIRILSEVTSSDGSSSMATVCASSIALSQGNFALAEHVAGVSIGAFESKTEIQLVCDMNEIEDRFSMMDFKIAGTKNSIVAMQLDTKDGISSELFEQALETARLNLDKILNKMDSYSNVKQKTYVYVKKVLIDSDNMQSLARENEFILKGLATKFEVDIQVNETEIVVSSKNKENTSKAVMAIIKLSEL